VRSVKRLLRIYFRLQIPSIIALLFCLCGFLNTGILPRPEMVPMTTLIFLFYWACYWPRMLHPAFLFAVGLLEDILSGSVIGLHAFLYILIYMVVISQRRLILKEPFPVVWAIFAFTALSYTLLSLLAFRIFEGHFFFGWQPFSQWLMTVVLYPFLHQLSFYLQVFLVRGRPVNGRGL
jgi:rod shape-determining protein MreD